MFSTHPSLNVGGLSDDKGGRLQERGQAGNDQWYSPVFCLRSNNTDVFVQKHSPRVSPLKGEQASVHLVLGIHQPSCPFPSLSSNITTRGNVLPTITLEATSVLTWAQPRPKHRTTLNANLFGNPLKPHRTTSLRLSKCLFRATSCSICNLSRRICSSYSDCCFSKCSPMRSICVFKWSTSCR